MTQIRETLREALRQHQAGQLAEAQQLYQQILAVEPQHAEALHLLGVVALQTGRHADAVSLIQRAVAVRSDQAAWFGNLGTALSASGEFEAAIAAYEKSLVLDPTYIEGHYNLGHVLSQSGNHAASEAAYRNALAVSANHVGSLNNLGTCLRAQGRSEEAVQHLRRAVEVAPDFVEGFYNLANTLRDVEFIDESLAAYRQALSLQPGMPKVHAGLGITLLLAGDMDAGAEHYEYRLQAEGGGLPAGCEPMWDGSALQNQTIMLFAEQGLGDTLQFVRHARELKSRGATVYLASQKPLLPILGSYQHLDGRFALDDELPNFDVAAPLLSLPRLLGTRVETIPAETPYLSASPELVERWAAKFAELPGRKVGIAWQGASGFLSDKRRSIPLAAFESLARLPDVTLVSLQKGFGTEQIETVDFAVHDVGEFDTDSGSFMDTAAMMMNLDLVITSDTSIAHLAGALGVPVWIALSKGADWRWLLERSDSPWYPSATLYRQTDAGDWDDVFVRMAQDLAAAGSAVVKRGPITIEVSAGELIDKISILQIKQQRIGDQAKLRNIETELTALTGSRDASIAKSSQLDALTNELRTVNETLWGIEDQIRECERQQDFGDAFVQLARQVYVTNDRRSAIKRQINDLLGSRLVEEKSYSDYA